MRRHEPVRTPPRDANHVPPVYRVTVAAFDTLRDELEPVLAERKAKARSRRPRRRKPGAGRKPKPGSDDRLLLVLMYYRLYVTQVVRGGLFGVDAGTACRVIRAVGLALTGVFRIPERKVRLGADTLGGDPVTGILTRAPGNNAPTDGLKVVTDSGWVAARPSGIEDVYKSYAESFRSRTHLNAIVEEGQQIVLHALSAADG